MLKPSLTLCTVALAKVQASVFKESHGGLKVKRFGLHSPEGKNIIGQGNAPGQKRHAKTASPQNTFKDEVLM